MNNDYQIYVKTVRTLNEIKYCFGPQAVSGTLLKRPILRNYLRNRQKKLLDDLEKDIANLK